ncbi:DUF624 domain-containing protein [Streptomyces sp. PSKA54]|uniref:DUF624 domain-containing protein n=1 Tax=Streptomyces himalayensis subsp. aureolus TaxID=2758039 RepID=A0A7W2D8L0_9ACTN|nr:DUF624 domain-containing protein [Streptomyces himalayensis]MBA4866748.1 DUF624 domain-containing protein [Streptomyces himalayensis subsp. aureolus]
MFSFEGFVRINAFLTAVYRVAFLNVLWVATTALGLGLFGVGPASYALAKYVDRWLRAGETPPPARVFWRYAREQAGRSMLVSWILLAAGGVIITNVFLASSWYVRILNVGALGVLGIAWCYVYPVLAATDLDTIPRQLGGALLVGFGSLHWTIIGATGVGATWWLLWQFALPLLVLFGVGIPAYAVGLVTRAVFRGLTPADAAEVGPASTGRGQAEPARPGVAAAAR